MADHVIENGNEVINPELIKGWLLWGFVWVLLAPTLGVIISTKFTYPGILGGRPGADVRQVTADSRQWRDLRDVFDSLHRSLLLHRAQAGAGPDLQRGMGLSHAVDLEPNSDRRLRRARSRIQSRS